jgi:gamma-glutamyltranspeptidase
MPEKLFVESMPESEQAVLERLGHEVVIRPAWTAVQMVLKTKDGYIGASDPRKLGRPAGAKK